MDGLVVMLNAANKLLAELVQEPSQDIDTRVSVITVGHGCCAGENRSAKND